MIALSRLACVWLVAAACGFGFLFGEAQAAPDKPRPNVIFVITDDQGYKDVHAHEHPYIDTPNLDALHAVSVRAVDFHVRPTCSPTRAAIMAGRSPIKCGIWHTIMGRSLMHPEEVTLGEMFQSAGYATGMFGKWHLGDNYPLRPEDQGFDVVVRHLGGGVTQGPDYFGNDYSGDHYQRNGVTEAFDGFCTDIWFDEALQFIEQNRERPFFAYLATNAPHAPWNVQPQDEKPYLEKGVAKTAAPYYGLIANIDDNMGRLMKKLDELQLTENTILIFTTDNGPAGGWPLRGDMHTKPLPNFTAGMTGAKGSCYEGGHRVPLFVRWPAGGLGGENGRDVAGNFADIDILPTLAELCGIKRPKGPELDGISFAKVLHGGDASAHDDRYHVIQSQRMMTPSKKTRTVVLQGPWRLVLSMKDADSVELFNMIDDRRQQHNVAEKHPERVEAMLAAYDRWWEEQQPAMKRHSRIGLGSEAEPVSRLMSHDWLTENIAECVWSQGGVQRGQMGNGPWAVAVERDGLYEFTLRRWPQEAAGPIEAKHARIAIGDVELERDIEPSAETATFQMKLTHGKAMLQTWLTLPGEKQQSRGAYYVEVRRVDE